MRINFEENIAWKSITEMMEIGIFVLLSEQT